MLSEGCIAEIFKGEKPKSPVVQITKLITLGTSGATRMKAMVSDGTHEGLAMVTSEMASLITSDTIKLNACVRLKQFLLKKLEMGQTKTSKLLVIMGMELVEQLEDKIGEPVEFKESEEATSPLPSLTPAKPDAPASKTPQTSGASSRVAAPAFQPAQPSPASFGNPTPIEHLNPYNNRWTIKARVTSKSELRTVNTARGETSLFSFDLCDESGEISATCWREAADRLSKVIETGKVYLISRGSLKIANKKFSSNNNQYEMSLNFDTAVQLCADEPASLPTIRYNFVPISEIANKPAEANVDIIGVATNISATSKIMTKTGREATKRTAVLSDDSGNSIEVTIWGGQADDFPEGGEPVVAMKGLRVTEWNQKSLNTMRNSVIEVAPANDATARLQSWWAGGGSANTTSLSVAGGNRKGGAGRDDSRSSLEALKEMQPNVGETQYATVRGFISRLNPSRDESRAIWYPSCVKCSKKVIGDESSGWNCESCGWSGPKCSYRYILSVALMDSSTTAYATAFTEQATQVLGGKTADELKAIKDQSQAEYEAVLDAQQWKQYVLRLRGKMETYNSQQRLKLQFLKIEPLNFAAEARLMLADIKKYDLPEPPSPASPASPGAVKEEAVKEEATGGDVEMKDEDSL